MAAVARRFVELGVAPRLAVELTAQINSGVGNKRRLIELGIPPIAAGLIVAGIGSGTLNRGKLAEAGIIPRVAKEIMASLGGGTPGIPTLSATTAAVYSMLKVVPSYSGPVFQLIKPDNTSTLDVMPLPSGRPDYAAITTWGGGQKLTISIRYDQSGNGFHQTQTVAGSRPAFDVVAAERGIWPMMHDPLPSATAIPSPAKFMNIPVIAGLDRANFGVFQVVSPRVSLTAIASPNQAMAYLSFQPVSGTQDLWALIDYAIPTATTNGLSTTDGTTRYAMGVMQRTRTQSLLCSSSPTNEVTWCDGAKYTKAARTSAALVNGARDGEATTTSPSYHANYVTIIFSTAPSDADYAALDSWSKSAFAIPTALPSKRIVYGGSSLVVGFGVSLGKNPTFLMGKALGDDYEIIVPAIAGQTLSNEYINRVRQDFQPYNPSRRNVLIIDAASNDIAGATYTDVANAQSGADSFFTSTIVAYVNAAKVAGFYGVVVPTIVGRTGFNETTNYRLSALKRLNANIVAGAAANGYVASDRYGDARLVDPTNTTYFWTDLVHLNDAGTAILEAIDRAAVLSAMQ